MPANVNSDSPSNATDQNLEVVEFNTLAELKAVESDWQDLANHALDSNVFYEPAVMLAALSAFAAVGFARFIFVRHKQADHRNRFTGFFPMIESRRFHRAPVRSLVSWNFIHCFLCTPLVRTDAAAATVATFFRWLCRDSKTSVAEFRNIGEGKTSELIEQQISERKLANWPIRTYARAFFIPRENFDKYVQQAMSARHYKGIRRLERRLDEKGKLVFERLKHGEALEPWADEFLELESSGWKGTEATALASNQENRKFFLAALNALHSKDRLMMLKLTHGGRTVAMKCNFLCADGSFAFKIAFDESLRHYSPGVILEMENVRILQDEKVSNWMDSCADEDHIMINRLWVDRKKIITVAVSAGGPIGNMAVRMVPKMKTMYGRLKRKPQSSAPQQEQPAEEE